MQNIFGLKRYLRVNFGDQGGEDAAAFFTKKSDEDGGGDGKHGILNMSDSLEKILLPLGAMNQAAKTFENLEKSTIQGVFSPISNPIPGIIQIGTTHLNILGVNLLGEKQHLNMNATPEEIVGSVESAGDDGGSGESSSSDDDDYHDQSQHGDMFDGNDFSEHHDDLLHAGQQILSGGDDYEPSYDLSSARGAEHYDDGHHYTPDYTPQNSHSHSEGISHDD